MRRRSLLMLFAALALLMLPAVAGTAGAAGPSLSPPGLIVAHWTPARMRAAVPRDFVRAGGSLVPKARPGTGGGVTGASWTKGGAILNLSGKVYFEMGGGAWVCSGSVANDNGRAGYSLVL